MDFIFLESESWETCRPIMYNSTPRYRDSSINKILAKQAWELDFEPHNLGKENGSVVPCVFVRPGLERQSQDGPWSLLAYLVIYRSLREPASEKVINAWEMPAKVIFLPSYKNVHLNIRSYMNTHKRAQKVSLWWCTLLISVLWEFSLHILSPQLLGKCAVNFKKQCGQMPRKRYRDPVCRVTRLTMLWKVIAWEFSIAKERWNILT